jgi:hypothetical protein
LISYDLDKPGQNYTNLIAALEQAGGKRVLFSQWVVRLNNTSCVAVRDWLWSLMDSNDRLLVVCLDSNDWASMRSMVNINAL